MSIGFLLAPAASTPTEPGTTSTTTDFTIQLERSGIVLPLTGQWHVMAGSEGLDDITVDPVVERLPDLYGEVETGVAVGARDVFLPLLLHCDTGAEWERARRDLRAVANPLAGPVTVVVVRPDGTSRRITGRAQVRVDSWDVDTWSVRGWQRLGLLVHCPDPWWRVTDAVRDSWTSPSTVGWFDTDIGELQLEPDAAVGTPRTYDVDSDVETYPTVVITDTAGVVTLVHSSGRSWAVDCTGATMPITVVTEPTATSVTDGTGADAWSRVAAPADLWPIPPGQSQITVTMTGYTAATQVEIRADGLLMAAVA